MAETKYEYDIITDTANSKLASGVLANEIKNSSITEVLSSIDTDGTDMEIWFESALSSGEETILDGLVAAHEGEARVLEMDFVYDSFRDKHLSIFRQKFLFSDNDTNCNNKYLRYGVVRDSDIGCLMPRPATIVGVFGMNQTAKPDREIQVHNDGVNIMAIPWPNEGLSVTNLNVDIEPGSFLQVRALSPIQANGLNRPALHFEIAWRDDENWDGTI